MNSSETTSNSSKLESIFDIGHCFYCVNIQLKNIFKEMKYRKEHQAVKYVGEWCSCNLIWSL